MTAETTLREALEPRPDICYGRDAQCKNIEGIPHDEGVAFLFGGRLAGKTTVLLKVRDSLVGQAAGTSKTGLLVVAVYLTPKALSPLDSCGFCKALLQEAVRSCAAHIAGFQRSPTIKDGLTILEFASEMDALLEAAGQIHLRVLFLLDDCKKLAEFHPDFVGNLQWLLCTRPSNYRPRLSMAFAGGPEMRSMLLDKISAPRPALIYLENLKRPDVETLVRETTTKNLSTRQVQTIASVALEATGGHPGLLRPFIEEVFMSAKTGRPGLKATISEFPQAKEGLFDRIMHGLSPEALCVQELLCSQNGASRAQVEKSLQTAGFDHHKSPEVLGELRFNGIATLDKGVVSTVGRMYWAYARQFLTTPAGPTAPAIGGPHSSQTLATAAVNLFRRKGECWEIRFAGQETLLPDSEGLSFIHKLLTSPNVPLRVTELSPGAVEDKAPDDQAITTAEHRKLLQERDLLQRFLSGSVHCLTPREKERAEDDSEDGVEAESEADEHSGEEEAEAFPTPDSAEDDLDVTARTPERVLKAEQRLRDIEAILRATTHAGKPKKLHNSSDERARKRVLAGVARSLNDIARKAPKLKEHLWGAKAPKGRRTGALETGWICRYRGDASIPWVT